MTERVSIILLGGRLTPNLVGILALRPVAVEFIVSQDTPNRYRELHGILVDFAELDCSGAPRYLSAYDFAASRDACLAVAQRHTDAEIIFDISSAPKIMGFAAYEVARFLHQRAIIVDTTNGRLIDLFPPSASPVPIDIDLSQYLACYGRRPESAFEFGKLSVSQQQAIDAASYLATAGTSAVEAMDRLRSWSQGKGKRTIPFGRTQPLSSRARGVLRQLESFGLIANLQEQRDGRVQYTILTDMDWKYLEGTWLEVYVWYQALQCRDEQGQPMFQQSQVGLSFEIPSDGARKEVDVGYVYHGQLVHVSCKTGVRPFRTQYLDELSAVSGLIGGRFTSRIFVTNAFPSSRTDPAFDRFRAQAEDREIVVVTGKDLPEVGRILKQEALRPTYRRI